MPHKSSYRMTPQRQIILDELRQSHSHPTADQLYDRVRRRLPRVSLGTVYRNLEVLAEQGVIQRVDGIGTQRRFDINPQRHFHVRCLQCGRVDDIETDLSFSVDDIRLQPSGYEICDVHLEFLGVCPDCQEKRDVSP